jgi:hypothetical protein
MKASKFDISLIQCYKCGGYFNDDRIDAHSRVCVSIPDEKPIEKTSKKPFLPSYTFDSEEDKTSNDLFLQNLEKELKNEGKPSVITNTTTTTSTAGFTRPITLVCYLCGKEFGTSSLEIHLKSCRKNFAANNKGVDPESLRPDILKDVMEMVSSKKGVDYNLVTIYNQEAERNYKDTNYFPCQTCGRKFPEDRLEIHLRGCKPKSGWQNVLNSKPSGNNLNKSAELSTTPKKLNDSKTPKILKNTTTTSSVAGSMGFGQKPNFLICYICGREFGKHSLEIHIKKCIEKQTEIAEQEKSSKSKSKNMYKNPEELENIFSKLALNEEVNANEILEYNKIANEIFRENTMKPCPNCNRRFLPDRLEVHLKSCKSKGTSGNSSIDYYKRAVSPGPSSRPRMLMCPLCGREFGTLSLPIHMKTCREKFELEQQRLPKNQRKSADAIIEKYNQINTAMKNDGNFNVFNLNNDAYRIWNDEALVACDNCGRTFLPDRLQVHLRSCKKK